MPFDREVGKVGYCAGCLSSSFKLTTLFSCTFCDGQAEAAIKARQETQGMPDADVSALVAATRHQRRHTRISFTGREGKNK